MSSGESVSSKEEVVKRRKKEFRRDIIVVLVFIVVAVVSIVFILLAPPLSEEAGEAYYLAIDDVRLGYRSVEGGYEIILYIKVKSTVGKTLNVTDILVDGKSVIDFESFNATPSGVEKSFVVTKVSRLEGSWSIGSEHVVIVKYIYKNETYTASVVTRLV